MVTLDRGSLERALSESSKKEDFKRECKEKIKEMLTKNPKRLFKAEELAKELNIPLENDREVDYDIYA